MSRLGLAREYKVRFLMALPSEIVMEHDLHLMYASVVAIHSLPKINRCPPSYDLGCKTTKYVGYSHESTETTTSSTTPYGLMVDLSDISRIVGVGLRLASPSCFKVSKVITIIDAPKSTKTL